jgi:fatty acid desaturase
VHECLHGHPTRIAWVNEALMALPLYLAYPYRRFKATHLAHHCDARLTDPFDDPETWYRAQGQWDRAPRWLRGLLVANNTLLGRIVLGPWLGALGFYAAEARLVRAGDRRVIRAWVLHLAGVFAVALLVAMMDIPLTLYLLAVVWPALGLLAIRTFAEHRWHEDPSGRTIIVERSPLAWLFLYNNLHIVHHLHPTVPWYRLPRLYADNRDRFRAANHGYWYPNYWALFRAHALRPKEPVPHPALRRAPDAATRARPAA